MRHDPNTISRMLLYTQCHVACTVACTCTSIFADLADVSIYSVQRLDGDSLEVVDCVETVDIVVRLFLVLQLVDSVEAEMWCFLVQ